MIAESDYPSTISGRIVVNGVGGELCVAFIRSLLRTSRTHVSAVGCFLGGLPLSRLTGGAVGDTSCTSCCCRYHAARNGNFTFVEQQLHTEMWGNVWHSGPPCHSAGTGRARRQDCRQTVPGQHHRTAFLLCS